MSATTPINRAITGPFEMKGVSWKQYGHYGLVSDLPTAQAAAEKLQELGFKLLATKNMDHAGIFYCFAFMGDYSTSIGRYEMVRIVLVAGDYIDRPKYEIVYRQPDGEWARYGHRIYGADFLVDGLDLTTAQNKYGAGNVQVRLTLWP